MRKFLTVILVSLFILIPIKSRASWYGTDPASLAKWAGCQAEVITSENYSPYSSMYRPGGTLYIGTRPGVVPRNTAIAITFHEIGHCIQDQNGWLNDTHFKNIQEVELDADRQAVDFMCRYQMDGRSIWRNLWETIASERGRDGDPNHGTVDQRISQGELAEACRVVPAQA